MKQWVKGGLCVVALALTACSATDTPRPKIDERQQLEIEIEASGKSRAEFLEGLISKSTELSNGGDYEKATAIAERALRLEPQDPFLWYKLARLYAQQGNFTKAESYALRTIRFSRDNKEMQIRGWRFIEQSRMMFGNMAGARYAAERVEELENE